MYTKDISIGMLFQEKQLKNKENGNNKELKLIEDKRTQRTFHLNCVHVLHCKKEKKKQQ